MTDLTPGLLRAPAGARGGSRYTAQRTKAKLAKSTV
ncbi:hypothetical protein QE394_003038 [Arthrobacter sp. SORGH_AS 212]|nr:hypothetical protein [Arthrobacter sp. SORGH_AS_0212]